MTRQGGWPSTGFAGRLKAQREQAGLSQKELADKVGCHYMTISELERGTQEPAWPLVRALARALGVSCAAFESDEDAIPEPPKPRGRPRKITVEDATPKRDADVVKPAPVPVKKTRKR
jgi:transcriptional regulator with XRE-family HTH domain